MAHKPYWYREIPEKLRWLDAISDPILDRRAIQTVFKVSKAGATRIMLQIGATPAGSSLVVLRWKVIEWLMQVQATESAAGEIVRLARVGRALEAARPALQEWGHKARLIDLPPPPPPSPSGRGVDALSWLRIDETRLVIEHSGPEDVVRKLQRLGIAIAEDLELFQQRATKPQL
jgi:hypothetical protein